MISGPKMESSTPPFGATGALWWLGWWTITRPTTLEQPPNPLPNTNFWDSLLSINYQLYFAALQRRSASAHRRTTRKVAKRGVFGDFSLFSSCFPASPRQRTLRPPSTARNITMSSPQGDDKTAAVPGAEDQQQTSQQPQSPPKSPSSTDKRALAAAAAARLHRPIMPTLPESRPQTFDEIYGPPENFLEIEVQIALCPLLNHPTAIEERHVLTGLNSSTGAQPTDTWCRSAHVHRLRNRLPHQYSSLQAAPVVGAATVFGFWILPRYSGTRERPSDYPSTSRQSVYQPVQWRGHRESESGAGEVPQDRCRAPPAADREQGVGCFCAG